MEAEPKAGKLIEELCEVLSMSQIKLASLLSLSRNTLTNIQDRPLSELTPRTRNRLIALHYVVLEKLSMLRPEAIFEIINTPALTDPFREGVEDSVISAIIRDEFPLFLVGQIADAAQTKLREGEKESKERVRVPYESYLSGGVRTGTSG